MDNIAIFKCLFCGGPECKYENWHLWLKDPDRPNAVDGLFSNWITDDILAMQRPSSRIIRDFHLVDRFEDLGIGAIFNLQEIGEHEFCGDGIETSSGFSYLPEVWMDAGISYFNFGWRDMDVPTLDFVLRLVQVMHNELRSGKKIAVHCHAGLGRTGVSIACLLVFAERMSPVAAISKIRNKRPLSVQNSKQQAFVQSFKTYLSRLYNVFPTFAASKDHEERVTFSHLLDNQRLLLHGNELRLLRHIPKVVLMIVERLMVIILSKCRIRERTSDSLPENSEGEVQITTDICAEISERMDEYFRSRTLNRNCSRLIMQINEGFYQELETEESGVVLIDLLLHWLLILKEPLLSERHLSLFLEDGVEVFQAFNEGDKSTFYTINCILNVFRVMPNEKHRKESLKILAPMLLPSKPGTASENVAHQAVYRFLVQFTHTFEASAYMPVRRLS